MKQPQILLIIVAIIICLAIAYYIYKNKKNADSKPQPTPEPTPEPNSPNALWNGIQKDWPDKHGAVLETMVEEFPGNASINWVNANAPNSKNPTMDNRDADVLCKKACDGWKDKTPNVGRYCNCNTKTNIGF